MGQFSAEALTVTGKKRSIGPSLCESKKVTICLVGEQGHQCCPRRSNRRLAVGTQQMETAELN